MGFFLGLFSSATFGLIPLFTLPLLHSGMTAESALFYRFLIASLTLGAALLLRNERFTAPVHELFKAAGMSLMYTLAALLLFWAFSRLPSGAATTIQFLYPVMVMLVMICFFHERFSLITTSALILAVAGVALLSGGAGEGGQALDSVGVAIMLLSALCNALYIVGIHAAGVRCLSGPALTFYVLFFGAVMTLAYALATDTFQWLRTWEDLALATLLAVITAVLSNFTLILAVRRIGSTLTSVLGVMEPLTAVVVGILVFHEPFTPALTGGVLLISASVMLVMLGRQLQSFFQRRH